MVVVGIIGALASIAIPNYIRFISRARQAEAKTLIVALAHSEKVYYENSSTYTDNLYLAQWAPTGTPAYVYGFTTDAVPIPSGFNNSSLMHAGFSSAKMVDAFGVPLTGADLPTAPASQTGFTIGAVGNIDNDADLDLWTLNDANVLVNVVNDGE